MHMQAVLVADLFMCGFVIDNTGCYRCGTAMIEANTHDMQMRVCHCVTCCSACVCTMCSRVKTSYRVHSNCNSRSYTQTDNSVRIDIAGSAVLLLFKLSLVS